MREMSGRLEEMPGEEGYPAYLASRLAAFYERAGEVMCLASKERRGSVSAIGAVSPPGGDLSDPVVQGTLRVTKVFWGLDDQLAFQRHFPAINWLTSYSLYQEIVDDWAKKSADPAWLTNRRDAMALLKREAELEELVRLVGMDSLSAPERLLLESARMVREDFLHQNAFEDIDTYTSMRKQFFMLDLIMTYYRTAVKVLSEEASLEKILSIAAIEEISRAKLAPEDKLDETFAGLKERVTSELEALAAREVVEEAEAAEAS